MLAFKLILPSACLFMALALAGVTPALAALGQSPTRLSSAPGVPGARMLAIAPTARVGAYTAQETQLESGTTVREYATPAGRVFAVSWMGPVLPDLDVLLGNYFGSFKLETDNARLKGRRGAPVDMARDGLVVRSNGRMRNFFGHAYVVDLIPAGVAINDLLE